jgi:hypothetical protein
LATACALIFALATLAASPADIATQRVSVAKTTSRTASVTRLFTAAAAGNQQGLAVCGGVTYLGYITSRGGQVIGYRYGRSVFTATNLPTGHTAEIACGVGVLYIANGGLADTPVDVYLLDLVTRHVTATLDFSAVGENGMVGSDPRSGHLLVFSGQPGGPWKITETTPDGTVLESYPLPDVGTPQGIEVVDGHVFELTSTERGRFNGNHLVEFAPGGKVLSIETVPVTAETEGLGYDPTSQRFVFGAATHVVYSAAR